MIIVLQRISHASVTADGEPYAQCGAGLLLLLGVAAEDSEEDARMLAQKIAKLRVFEDENGKLNRSVNDIGGDVMVVPNFTLLAAYKKGNRPDFMGSAAPAAAEALFQFFCQYLSTLVPSLCCGKFRSDMQVSLVNDGPLTIAMDSRVLKGERSI